MEHKTNHVFEVKKFRLGRRNYFWINILALALIVFGILCLNILRTTDDQKNTIVIVLGSISVIIYFVTTLVRLREINGSWWWMIAAIFPVTNVMLFAVMCVVETSQASKIESEPIEERETAK
jgi:uncharacterized membrane protein YhaH (DUF805 family)